MIDGIFKKINLENMPITEAGIKNRNFLNAEKSKAEKSVNTEGNKLVNNDDLKQEGDISTEKAIEKIVDAAKIFNRKIRLEVEEDLNILIVKIIDSETEKVIRQIPPEELVELSKNARDLKGLLINKEG